MVDHLDVNLTYYGATPRHDRVPQASFLSELSALSLQRLGDAPSDFPAHACAAEVVA